MVQGSSDPSPKSQRMVQGSSDPCLKSHRMVQESSDPFPKSQGMVQVGEVEASKWHQIQLKVTWGRKPEEDFGTPVLREVNPSGFMIPGDLWVVSFSRYLRYSSTRVRSDQFSLLIFLRMNPYLFIAKNLNMIGRKPGHKVTHEGT